MHRKQAKLAVAVSAMALILSSILFIFGYARGGYLPFLLAALPLAGFGIVDLILLIFGFSVSSKRPTPRDPTDERGLRLVLLKLKSAFCRSTAFVAGIYERTRNILSATLTIVVIVASQTIFWIYFGRSGSIYSISAIFPILTAALFVVFTALEKWSSHVSRGAERRDAALLENLRSDLISGKLLCIITAVSSSLKLLGIADLQRPTIIAEAVVFCYLTLFAFISMLAALIKKEFGDYPDMSIPIPFSGKGKKDHGILGYLEKNTGITMRSLWSIRLVKELIPYMVILCAVLLWGCTGLVQIEANEEGALYRFGHLCDDTLSPGLHLTLPYPFDRVERYDTTSIQRMTVGYISSEDTDNIWTSGHGSSEYKLLLGGGNELVSINLRVEYKIGDLREYLRCSSSPDDILRALAYEAVTVQTINTDLNTLLAADRTEFARSFKEGLDARLSGYHLGIDVVSIVLESIHPPIEIAKIYQEIVSAGIKAEQYLLEAEAKAAVTKAEAEQSRDTAINTAEAEKNTAVAAAHAEVASFVASLQADTSYSDTYRYNKYLTALTNAYGKAQLVIVGEGVDSSKIFFGDLPSRAIQ